MLDALTDACDRARHLVPDDPAIAGALIHVTVSDVQVSTADARERDRDLNLTGTRRWGVHGRDLDPASLDVLSGEHGASFHEIGDVHTTRA